VHAFITLRNTVKGINSLLRLSNTQFDWQADIGNRLVV